jgi:alkanesulfonate monooxygenase SsuD/methylene tetrahydromethanopterin reductase-like flavin-dependent oxidoreductase (luciferase family)
MWDGSTGRSAGTAVLESYLSPAGFAVGTERVKLGVLVAGAPYRNPALLAKMVTTLDVMSHGRAICGIGAGWARLEFGAYGWELPDVPTRQRGSRGTIQIVRRVSARSAASHAGKVFSTARARNDPPPVSRPHPHLDRRQRRAHHPAPRRPLRRQLQRFRRARAGGVQVRRPAPPPRRSRTPLRGGHQEPL